MTWRVDSRAVQLGAGTADGRLSIEFRTFSSPTCTTVASLLCRLPTLGYRVQFSLETGKTSSLLFLLEASSSLAPCPWCPPGVSLYPAELVTHLFTSPGLGEKHHAIIPHGDGKLSHCCLLLRCVFEMPQIGSRQRWKYFSQVSQKPSRSSKWGWGLRELSPSALVGKVIFL